MRRKFIFLTAAFVLLAFLAVPLGMRGQTRDVETFTFSELGYDNTEAVTTVDGTNVTLTFDQGTSNNAPKYYTTGSGVRMYTGNTLEVALNDQEGETRITAINFTFSGTYTGSLQNWIGSETSVSFTNTASGQARIQVIEVTYSEGGVAPITYTVTYNANVTGVTPIVDTYNESANVTLRPANTFNYEGHTFSEWNTQADGDGDPYDAGDVIENIQANLQLYAIWIEDTPSGDGVVDVLNWVATGSPNSYTDWTYQAPSGTEYAGQSSGTYQSIQLRSSNNNSGIVTTTSIGNVTKVAVSWNDNTAIGRTLNVYGSNSSYSAATDLYGDNAGDLLGTIVKGTNTVLNINGNYAFIGLRSASGALYLDEIDITWSVDGTPVPSITAGNVEIAYNATNGAIEYTINNPAEGGVLSATTEAEWLTIGTVGATVPFTCSMNDDVERTATVTLIYTYNSDQTISKNVTVTQASNPNAPGSETNPYTVAQARAAIDAGMGTQGVYATGIVSEIPTPYNSTYGNITFNMVDEAGDEVFLQAYRCGGEEAANVAIGDVVVVYGNLTKYGSTYEFGQGCEVVSLTHSDTPSITVTPATVNFAATGTNGIQMDSLTIVYENIMVTNYQSFTVQFYDNQGNETTVPTDWLIVGVTGTNEEGYVVRCVVGDNDGESRTACFKVYAFDAENNKVYSNLVTVNQAEYVAPTYATLPFEFDGGKAAIDTIDGLYQEGLGSDYGSSPKLKFDHTGDWLLLQFQEVPGTLTFDIKGNSFSNGTFTVQTSENGVTYTDLASYTEFDGTVQHELFGNLGANVRYIRWIYTEKGNGNVALGNIVVSTFPTEPFILVETDLIEAPFEGAEGYILFTYGNLGDLDITDFFIEFCSSTGSYNPGDYEYPNWMHAEVTTQEGQDGYFVHYVVDPNVGEARAAYFQVYGPPGFFEFKAGGWEGPFGTSSEIITVNQAAFVVDYATLPFEFDGGRADIANISGLTQDGLDSDYSSSPKLKFNTTGDWVILHFNERPGTLTFDIKGNNFSGGTFTVQTSEDGVTYTDLAAYTELGETQSEDFNNLGENVRYIKWIYTEKVNGNVALGNIHLYEFGGGPVIETYDLIVEPFENLEIFTFVDDDLTESMEGAGTIQVAEGKNVMLSVSANEGYEIRSLMVDGTEHVNDIAEDLTYTFVMPAHNVTVSATAAPVVPFEPATYTLATTIESGKTYIIVGSKVIDSVANYFAMGEQRTNNRGGVAISVDGTTATVDSEKVHEFVITDLGDGFYSIYDGGYLYAASNSANQLRTMDTLNENGKWEITINDTTGMFSVVASQSSNRNVMQFNGSGSNALFACYASANQSPVYLYVKDEEATVTQTIALNAGWNWVSFNVEVTLDDVKAALVDSLSGSIVTIKSQNDGLTIFNGTRWRGALSSLDVTQMYKIKVDTSCEIMLEGKPINPVEHPITIRRGVNWIGFPLSQSMTLSDVFGSFAVNGDRIASKTQNIVYNGGWRGRLTTLEPGQGYVYTSNQVDDRVFVFPANTK